MYQKKRTQHDILYSGIMCCIAKLVYTIHTTDETGNSKERHGENASLEAFPKTVSIGTELVRSL